MRRWRGIGPGLIVTAAFIGPGTVTTATLAGAQFGTALLWTLAFATVATIVLQEMSARLGLVTRGGLGRALRELPGPPWLGTAAGFLAVGAVVVGAMAYQAGNLTGAGLGLAGATGLGAKPWAAIIALIAAGLLWLGHYRLVERFLMACVAVMGIVFLVTALLVLPRVTHLFSGFFVPRLPAGAGTLTALGLIGTTIVPYNLFLHAAVAAERWPGRKDLPGARLDLVLAIGFGGIISGAIVVTAAATLGGQQVSSAGDMAVQLEPLLGAWAGKAFAIGFAAAGISSAITAPLAAAYATLDVLGRGRDVRSGTARAVFGTTMFLGAIVALLGTKPVALILLAQVANGFVLPIIAAALLIAMNDSRRLGDNVNGLGVRAIAGVF